MKLFRLLVLVGIVSSVSAEANKNSTLDFDAVTGATEIVSQRNHETMTRADSITTPLKNNGRGGAGHDNLDKSYDTQLTAMKKGPVDILRG